MISEGCRRILVNGVTAGINGEVIRPRAHWALMVSGLLCYLIRTWGAPVHLPRLRDVGKVPVTVAAEVVLTDDCHIFVTAPDQRIQLNMLFREVI